MHCFEKHLAHKDTLLHVCMYVCMFVCIGAVAPFDAPLTSSYSDSDSDFYSMPRDRRKVNQIKQSK